MPDWLHTQYNITWNHIVVPTSAECWPSRAAQEYNCTAECKNYPPSTLPIRSQCLKIVIKTKSMKVFCSEKKQQHTMVEKRNANFCAFNNYYLSFWTWKKTSYIISPLTGYGSDGEKKRKDQDTKAMNAIHTLVDTYVNISHQNSSLWLAEGIYKKSSGMCVLNSVKEF